MNAPPRRSWLLGLGLALLACGSGEVGLGGSGALEGDGAFEVKAAYFQVADVRDSDNPGTAVTVQLLRDPIRCDELFLASREGVTVGVLFPEGDYPERAPELAIDNAQVASSAGLSTVGQMKVETAADDKLVGSFNARQPLEDGGTAQLSGTFDAVRCETSESGG